MSRVLKLVALGVSLMLSLGACAVNQELVSSQRCDHRKPKTYVVKVTLDRDVGKKPEVDKDIVACADDEIVFDPGANENITIRFPKGGSPFEWEKKSSKGKMNGKVKVNPTNCPTIYKYDVVDDGNPKRPVLDPRIIITPR